MKTITNHTPAGIIRVLGIFTFCFFLAFSAVSQGNSRGARPNTTPGNGGSSNCLPVVGATFSSNGLSVTTTSTKDLSNVVLLFCDGTHYKFDNLSGFSQTFSGIGSNTDKKIAGVWIKSGCNNSNAGPGYGAFVANPDPNVCLPELPPIPCDTRIGADGLEANWAATASIKVLDFNGVEIAPYYVDNVSYRPNSGGLGVLSVGAPETAANAKFELGWRAGLTETIELDFSDQGTLTWAKVRLARFYIENGKKEQGLWFAYAQNGDLVDDGNFFSSELITNGGPGYYDLEIKTIAPFTKLVFEAAPNVSLATNLEVLTGSDNSDYLIREITVICEEEDRNPPPFPCDTRIGEAGTEEAWLATADIAMFDFNGNPIAPYFVDNVSYRANSGGMGILSVGAPETAAAARFELGWRDDKTERAELDFSTRGTATSVKVKLARFYIEQGKKEKGLWYAYDIDNNLVGSGEFFSTEPIGNGGPGYYDVIIQTAVPFTKLVFEAAPNVSLSTNLPVLTGDDNSDYLIREITVECVNNGRSAVDFKEATSVENQISVFPSPAAESVNLTIASKDNGVVNYVVRDMMGRVITSASMNVHAGENNTVIPVSQLVNGMYLITVNHQGKTTTSRFTVKH